MLSLSPDHLTLLLSGETGYFIQKVEDCSSEGGAWPVSPESRGSCEDPPSSRTRQQLPELFFLGSPLRVSVVLRFFGM